MSNYSAKRTIIGHLERGTDLHDGITRIVQENAIRTGRVTGLGAVQKAKLAYYDQKQMKYTDIEINEPMEIVSMYGNVSVKDGKPFLHCHVALSDEKGNGKGGHLLPNGTPVFACEITIEEYEGPEIHRSLDERTGLTLWTKDKIL
ncbi:MAG: DNA-binding protein [Ignavibacteriae bacterium]|nr:DNA-binding protein [Ignavibacteriota bacterium]